MTELSIIAKATIVLVLALGTTRVVRRARASVRSLILASAFGLVLLLPLAPLIVPPRTVEIPSDYAPAFFIEQSDVLSSATTIAAPPAAAAPSNRPWRLPSIAATARALWAVGAVACVVPLVAGLWRVRVLRRRSRPWDEGQRPAPSVRAILGIRRRVNIVLADALVAPLTCGWRTPTIVMPADAPDWSVTDVQQALLHELEHVRRHDWPIHVVARLTCALYWFHPAVWMAWRQLSLESERACDDAVVVRAENTAYATQLVSLARRFAKGDALPLLSMADRRTLSTRVVSILSPTVARGRVGPLAAVVVLTAASVLAMGIAPVTPVGAQAPQRDVLAIPTATGGPPFEVVSVKPNTPEDRQRVNDWQPVTGRLILRNLTPKVMVTVAYANTATLFLPDDRLTGVPEWAGRDRFTIEASAGRSVTAAEMQRMLRRVMTERFGLRVHLEQREQTAYRLVRARADGRLGPNLQPADEAKCNESRRPSVGVSEWGPQSLVCTTIDLLTFSLSERLGRPILNQTGLTGLYNGTLSYAPSAEELAVIYRLLPSELPPAAMTGPSLTTALQEQLGLKLEPTRAAIDVLVVDRIDRPTPNDAPELAARVQSTPPSAGAQAFDVASVRLNKSGSPISRGPMIQPGNRLVAQNVMARTLITTAYGMRFEHVVGGPAWLNTDHFDLEAHAKESATLEDIRAMLRALLAERFGLRTHRETREQTVYALTAAGTRRATPGLRVTAAKGCAPIRYPARLPSFVAEAGGAGEFEPTVNLEKPASCERRFLPGFFGASRITMAEFAAQLTMFARGTVINRTGMSGEYDINLTFAPDSSAVAPATGDFVPLSTAVQEQLGLRLEATRGAIEVLVIDRFERLTEN